MKKILIGAFMMCAAGLAGKEIQTKKVELKSGIDLVSFEANIHQNKVELKWSTRSEQTNAYFIIERSADGKNFEEILKIEGAGRGDFFMEYFDADFNPLPGTSYYRLKQANADGEVLLHNLVAVRFEEGNTLMDETNNDILHLSADELRVNSLKMLLKGFEGKEVLVVIRSKDGQEFFSKVYLVPTKTEMVAIDPIGTLTAGEYLITAAANNKIFSQPVIVK